MPTTTPGQAKPPFVLTLDIGTSSVRAMLFDAAARPVEGVAAQIRTELHTAVDGTSEMDPAALLGQIGECIDTALGLAGSLAQEITAVGVDTLVSNLLGLAADGRLLTPLLTYADTRNSSDADELRRVMDERTVHQRTGCMLRTSYWPARLAWIKRVKPEVWQAAARWATLGEYLEQELFGQSRISYSAASWSGMLDRAELAWDGPLLEALGLRPEQLGTLADANAPLRGLREPYAGRWPALSEVPWFPAIGDGAAANLGSGCVGHARMALTVGTTGALRVVEPEVREVPVGLWCYRVDGRRALLGGATSEGGNVYAWMQRTLQLPDEDALETEIAAMAPDSHGLTMLPLLAGERSPGWAGNATASIAGITQSTTPAMIARAALEAVAYRFALIEERMCGDPSCGHRLIASGGALLRSPVWMQIIADVIGRPVVASAEPEATSRGVALLALESLGVIPSVEALPPEDGQEFLPRAEHRQRYAAAIARQQHLYDLLIVQG